MVKNRGGRGGGQMSRGNMRQSRGGRQPQGRMIVNRKMQSQQYRIQKPKRQDLIQKNLQHLQQNIQKKKIAQAMYYNGGRPAPSPRKPINPNSVHNRLGNNSGGVKGLQTKKLNTRVFNNSNLKRGGGPQNINNSVIGRKTQRFNQKFTVQTRIQRARMNLNTKPNVNFRNTNQAASPNQQNFQRKPIKLNRNIQPTNVKVQLENNTSANNKHSINANLNPRLQQEIRMIQSSSSFRDSIPSIPIHPQGAGVTKSTLHERFSQL